MSKNVAVFVDVANIFYAAKAAGVDIDYVTLLKSATAGRDLVRAYAYTGLDPDNENQRNFHDFLRRHGYKVVSKDIRKYGDGKVKANLDIELVVDMMKTARNLDIAIVISGDGDFAPAIRAVQEMGVRVEVISFRGNTSSDLMDVADQFTEITQVARVEKGSSRSGRRVAADDDEDLSMTEVPDKQSEGTGTRTRGGRGRSRTIDVELEPVAAPRSRSRARTKVADESSPAVVTSSATALVALPGEKLSKVAALPVAAVQAIDEADEPDDVVAGEQADGGEEEPHRRRRRRGGRGRGRGRGREDGAVVTGEAVAAGADQEDDEADEADEPVEVPAPRLAPPKRAAHAFGSVWDSQIGVPTRTTSTPSVPDDEDFDEPPIPEYLIAERRQRDGRGGGAGSRGGPRGGRAGYSAAVDRERYGGGRSGSASAGGPSRGPSRFNEPAPRGGGREPEGFRGDRPTPRSAPRIGSSDEPWSEVPPEIEAMLRAQLGAQPAPRRPAAAMAPEAPVAPASADAPAVEARSTRAATRPRGPRKAAGSGTAPALAGGVPEAAVEQGPKRRATRKGAAPTEATSVPSGVAAEASPKARATRKPAAAAASEATDETKPAPKRRTTRKAAEPAG